MARVWSCGFELNSLTDNVEITDVKATTTGATIDASVIRSGTYSLKTTFAVANSVRVVKDISTTNANFFIKFFFYVAVAPSVQTGIWELCDAAANESSYVGLRLKTDNTLVLYYRPSTGGRTAIGSPSAALSTGQWYQLEVNADMTSYPTSIPIEAKLAGTAFASSTVTDMRTDKGSAYGVSFGIDSGGWGDNAIGTWYYDDVAVNDATGSFQTTYPGAGKIIHLHPDSAGDVTEWVPDTGSNFARVSEVLPDDATSLVSDVVLNESDMYNCGASGINAADTVNVVSVGVRFSNDVADATTQFKVQIEKTSGGTISQSAAITPNSTTWKTNATASPFAYPITSYQDPDTSDWTQATLDTMQIGYKSTLIGVNKNRVSTVWALIDYTVSASTRRQPQRMLMGIG